MLSNSNNWVLVGFNSNSKFHTTILFYFIFHALNIMLSAKKDYETLKLQDLFNAYGFELYDSKNIVVCELTPKISPPYKVDST